MILKAGHPAGGLYFVLSGTGTFIYTVFLLQVSPRICFVHNYRTCKKFKFRGSWWPTEFLNSKYLCSVFEIGSTDDGIYVQAIMIVQRSHYGKRKSHTAHLAR